MVASASACCVTSHHAAPGIGRQQRPGAVYLFSVLDFANRAIMARCEKNATLAFMINPAATPLTRREEYINLVACVVFMTLPLFFFRMLPVWYVVPVAVLFAGLLLKPFRKALLRLWFLFSHALGTVNTSVLLFLIYFFLITPYALLFRKKAGGNYILRKPQQQTLFRTREHLVEKTDFEKSW